MNNSNLTGVIGNIYQMTDGHDDVNMMGQNALKIAMRDLKWPVATRLLDLGAPMKSLDKFGCNLLHYAAHGGDVNMTARIIEYGVDVKSVDNNGWSALHWAASSRLRTAEVIYFLLEKGCNKENRDKQGRTALDLAVGFERSLEAAVLRTEEDIYRLPEVMADDSELITPWGTRFCDGCYHVRRLEVPLCLCIPLSFVLVSVSVHRVRDGPGLQLYRLAVAASNAWTVGTSTFAPGAS